MEPPILSAPDPPKLVDRVRNTMRLSRYSPGTEQTYGNWIKRFIRFHGVRHLLDMGAEEVKAKASENADASNQSNLRRFREQKL